MLISATFVLLFLANLGVGSCEDLTNITCLDPDINSTLIQIARLHQAIVTNLDTKIDNNDNGLDEIKDLVAGLKLELETQKDELESQKDELESQKDELESQKDELEAQKDELEAQKDELEAQDREIQSLKTDAAATQRNLTAAESEISRLQTELGRTVKISGDGKISQSVLPGTYADYTLEDVQ